MTRRTAAPGSRAARKGGIPGAAVLVLAGCTAVYAPPVVTTSYGAPGRLEGETFEIGGAVMSFSGAPATERAAVRVTDDVAIELGANQAVADDGAAGWALGFAGIRCTLFDPDARGESESGVAFDIEAGGGLGVGGENLQGADSSRSPWTRLAGGGYLGFGLGLTRPNWATYVRLQSQATAADGVPLTLWWSALWGLEFGADPFDIHLDVGAIGFSNREFAFVLPYGGAGAALHF
jgi:hypothetical protein